MLSMAVASGLIGTLMSAMEDRGHGEIFHFLAESFPGDAIEEKVDAVVGVHHEETDGLREELTRG